MAQLKELTIYVWKRIDLLNDGKTKFHGYGWETYAWDDGTNGSMSHKDNISDIAHSIHKNCNGRKKIKHPGGWLTENEWGRVLLRVVLVQILGGYTNHFNQKILFNYTFKYKSCLKIITTE